MQPTHQPSTAEVPSKSAAELIPYDSREERAQAMERDGFVFLPAVLSPEQVQELRECSDRIKSVAAPRWDFIDPEGSGIKTIQNAFNRDPLYLDFLDKPGVIELVEDTLGRRLSYHPDDPVEHREARGTENARGLEADPATR